MTGMSAAPRAAALLTTAWLALAAAAVALLLLAGLHALSPEFDPSWHMVSEYAYGHHGWVLSLMFAFWALSSWALAATIWSELRTRVGKAGLIFLIAAGLGEAMASVFDINQEPLHDIAGYLSIPCLAIAAMVISVSLGRTPRWSSARKPLLWTANLTWISLVLLAGTFAVMIGTYVRSGATVDPNSRPTVLPSGVIGLVGVANRLLVVVYCAWVITLAWQSIRLQRK
jgi:hypothetical protein